MDNSPRVQVGDRQHKLICYRMGDFEWEETTKGYFPQICTCGADCVATVLAVRPFNEKLVQTLWNPAHAIRKGQRMG